MRLAVLLALCLIASPAAFGQGRSATASQRDWDPLFEAGSPDTLVFSDPDKTPRQIARLLNDSGCYYRPKFMVRAYRIRPRIPAQSWARAIAFAICNQSEWLLYFDTASGRVPQLIRLAVAARGQGFTTTLYAGALNWDTATRVLTAVQSSDLCSDSAVRHTYVFATEQPLASAPFVLRRIEWAPHSCGVEESEWRIVWQAMPWPAAP